MFYTSEYSLKLKNLCDPNINMIILVAGKSTTGRNKLGVFLSVCFFMVEFVISWYKKNNSQILNI